MKQTKAKGRGRCSAALQESKEQALAVSCWQLKMATLIHTDSDWSTLFQDEDRRRQKHG